MTARALWLFLVVAFWLSAAAQAYPVGPFTDANGSVVSHPSSVFGSHETTSSILGDADWQGSSTAVAVKSTAESPGSTLTDLPTSCHGQCDPPVACPALPNTATVCNLVTKVPLPTEINWNPPNEEEVTRQLEIPSGAFPPEKPEKTDATGSPLTQTLPDAAVQEETPPKEEEVVDEQAAQPPSIQEDSFAGYSTPPGPRDSPAVGILIPSSVPESAPRAPWQEIATATASIAAGLWVLLYLFTRLRPDRVIASRARQQVMRELRTRPWSNLTDLSRALAMQRTTLSYHLRVLQRHGHVKSYGKKRGLVYAAREESPHPGKAPGSFEVAKRLAGPTRLSEIMRVLVRDLKLSRSSAWNVVRLAQAEGLVRLVREARRVWVVPPTSPVASAIQAPNAIRA